MKKTPVIVLISLCLVSTSFGEIGFKGRPIVNNLWMPTGYTLHANEFIVGIGPIGFGITEHVQVSTNILLYLFQIFNGNLKLNLAKSAGSAFAVGVDVNSFDAVVFGVDASFFSVSPYAVFTTRIGPKTALHLGGQYSFFSSDDDIEDSETKATSSGTSVNAGIEHSITYKTKLLFEGGYDVTFEGYKVGGGILFGWESFRLKLGVSYFKPSGNEGFTMPVIGLWWRFKA
jgi:hypothetical protein